jgi:hypothetical protein
VSGYQGQRRVAYCKPDAVVLAEGDVSSSSGQNPRGSNSYGT